MANFAVFLAHYAIQGNNSPLTGLEFRRPPDSPVSSQPFAPPSVRPSVGLSTYLSG